MKASSQTTSQTTRKTDTLVSSYLDDDDELLSEDQIITQISELITQKTGVLLGKSKKAMVGARIHKRVIQLGIENTQQYSDFLRRNAKTEIPTLVSLLTTHHTFFFREFVHFEFMVREGLTRAIQQMRERKAEKLRIWSAACSRGHEAYSIAMLLDYHFRGMVNPPDFEIIGTDIDAASVDMARNAVYHRDEIKEIPAIYLGNHWARGKGAISQYAKFKDPLKKKATFHPLNLKDIAEEPLVAQPFDIIFCRNVFIYFDRPRITQIIEHMRDRLHPGGMLFLGLSEPINDPVPSLRSLGSSIYAHVPPGFVWEERISPTPEKPSKKDDKKGGNAAEKEQSVSAAPSKLRVLCVDDSPTILSVLKTILTEEHGFEIAGTATNGLEAAQFLKSNSVDLMTLDIHMPEQDGIQYLEKNMKPGHPPVLVVTSASREDPKSAHRCLELGAIDIVEKPSLLNIQERGDEIRNKLRAAFNSRKDGAAKPGPAEIELAFKKTEPKSFKPNALRVILAASEDSRRVKQFLKGLPPMQPQTLLLFHGAGVDAYAEATQISLGGRVRVVESPLEIRSQAKDQLLVGDFKRVFPNLKQVQQDSAPISILVFGRVPASIEAQLIEWRKPQLLLEDQAITSIEKSKPLLARANYCVPMTSFQYHSDRYLKGEET